MFCFHKLFLNAQDVRMFFKSTKNFTNILALRVPDEGYSRNASCALNLISTFLLHKKKINKHYVCISQYIE